MLATSIAAYEQQSKMSECTAEPKTMAMEIPRTSSPINMSVSPYSPRSFGVYGQSINSVIQTSELSCELSEQSLSMSVESDYLPKLEEDYCRNFTCCGVYLENLHQLQNHYEAEHSDLKSSASSRSSRSVDTTVSTAATSIHSDIQQQKIRLAQQQSSSMPGTPMIDMDVDSAPFKAIPRSFSAGMSCVQPNMLHNAAMRQQQLQQSRTVPVSMSTPLTGLHTQYQQQQQRKQPIAPLQPQPPRSTASTHTAMATGLSSHMPSEQNANIPANPSSTSAPFAKDEKDRDKPFKCPVPVSYKYLFIAHSDHSQGCNKAYKQQNGLKYHRMKGQCSFKQQEQEEQIQF